MLYLLRKYVSDGALGPYFISYLGLPAGAGAQIFTHIMGLQILFLVPFNIGPEGPISICIWDNF